jgi:hypothetical protein
MSKKYKEIFKDLERSPLETFEKIIRPFLKTDLPDVKENKWLKAWRRAKAYRQKETQRMLYYYLGEEIMEENMEKRLDRYHRTIAKRIYLIYEPLGEKYLRAGKTTLDSFKKISHNEFMKLREKALRVLSEREPLVGENLLSENMSLDEFTNQLIPQLTAVQDHMFGELGGEYNFREQSEGRQLTELTEPSDLRYFPKEGNFRGDAEVEMFSEVSEVGQGGELGELGNLVAL